MQPILEKVILTPYNTISVEEVILPHFISQWHFHPEVEIISIIESTGTLFIGNTMKSFRPGDMALIGGNVPHVWLNDKDYYSGNENLRAHSKVVKFSANFWGSEFANIPEMKAINELIIKASRGIWFDNLLNVQLNTLITEVVHKEGMSRVLKVIEILNLITQNNSFEFLSTSFDKINLTPIDCKKIDTVYKYIMENFSNEIRLEEIANIANMNPSAFCRYFKSHTLKTLSEVINEIRIGYACKLLTETDFSISEICFKSGFNYLSNFYKQFQKIKYVSPGNFQQTMIRK